MNQFKKAKIDGCSSDTTPTIPTNRKNKADDDAARLKKANRLKENLRQMLLQENPDDPDTKKKNAIYAYNFFEKVEETFISCGKENKYKKFVQILKTFDPEKDTAVNLYQKLEKLFLPDNPDLLDIFLTFMQPTEAYKAGKFFEHFMVTNMGTFINKLNIYFNKQPAQIRKIFNCLNELSEDTDLSLDKIKSKILPLLKGNQYLIDWFLQIFPEEKPPESLLQTDEIVNLKEIDSSQNTAKYETMQTKDILDDNPTDIQSCQLKYINGRIFYGSRLLLPAKLGFMAETLNENQQKIDKISIGNDIVNNNSSKCIHGIRQLGEEYLKVKDNNQTNTSGEENENKSEDDEQLKNSPLPTYEFCDEAILRMHAARLNPSLYSSENFTGNLYRTNRLEDGKCSPKKHSNRTSSNSTLTFSCSGNSKEKYKSPKKNFIKSPMSITANTNIIKKSISNETNIFATARKLKALCEDEVNEQNQTNDEQNKIKRKRLQKNNKFKSQESLCEQNISDLESVCDTNQDSIDNNTSSERNKVQQQQQPWTREEDKIILEEVKLGFQLHKELMNRIAKKLTDRSEIEINLRYKFLMDVLSQLQNKN